MSIKKFMILCVTVLLLAQIGTGYIGVSTYLNETNSGHLRSIDNAESQYETCLIVDKIEGKIQAVFLVFFNEAENTKGTSSAQKASSVSYLQAEVEQFSPQNCLAQPSARLLPHTSAYKASIQMSRVQIPWSVETQVALTSAAGGLASGTILVSPVVGASISIILRTSGTPAPVYAAETGSGTITGGALVTDSHGSVPGWLTCDNQYDISIGSIGSYGGAGPIGFDAVSGGGVSNIAPNAVGSAQIAANSVGTTQLANNSVTAAQLANNTVGINQIINGTVAAHPLGGMIPYAGTTNVTQPDGSFWVLTNGGTYSRTTYAAAFAIIGTVFGAGDGSTTFNVPDTRGRALVGAGAGAGLTSRALAAMGGEENHVLSTAELASHGHSINDPGHAHGVGDPGHNHGVNDPGHYHQMQMDLGGSGSGDGRSVRYGSTLGTGPVGSQNQPVFLDGTNISLNASATGIGIAAAATGVSANSTGSGTGHNNMQPFLAVNHLIRLL